VPADLVSHLLGLDVGVATVVGLVPPITHLVRMLV
jgi:hypothetical protein